MKKLYIILALIMSSFFFYSSGVKADTYNFTIEPSNANIITDVFLESKSLADSMVSSGKYMIYYKDSKYYRYSFTNNEILVNFDSNTSSFKFILNDSQQYYFNVTSWSWQGAVGSPTIILKAESSIIDYSLYVYSPFTFIYNGEDTINITYNNYTASINKGDKFPSLYDFYLNDSLIVPEEPEEPEEDTHVEEKQLLSNFYTLIIEKIVLLANSIAENYILLTVIGIFILIFLIYLIRRYLL